MESKQAVEEKRTEPLSTKSSMEEQADAGGRPTKSGAPGVSRPGGLRRAWLERLHGGDRQAAGVGIGTLYRHFPNRFDIVEAVYRDDVEELVRAAEQTEALEPWAAVEAFFEAFLRYTKTKQVLLNELKQGFEKNPDLRSRIARADRCGLRPGGRTGQEGRRGPRRRERLRPHPTGGPHLHERQHLRGADAASHQRGPRRFARHRSRLGALGPRCHKSRPNGRPSPTERFSAHDAAAPRHATRWPGERSDASFDVTTAHRARNALAREGGTDRSRSDHRLV